MDMEHTNATVVAGKAKLLKHHLVAVRLQRGEGVRLFGEDEASLGRVASLRCFVVEELAVPYLFLGLPTDNKTLLNGPAEGQLAKVPAFLQFGPDEGLSVPVSCDAVRDDARSLDFVARHKSGLDCVGAIVEHEC